MAAVKPYRANHRRRGERPSLLLAVAMVGAFVATAPLGARAQDSPSGKDPPSDSRPKAPTAAETKAGVVHPPDVDPAMSKPVPNVDPAMPKSPQPRPSEPGPKRGEPKPSPDPKSTPDIQPR